jgi:flagellar hook-associated protein 3 FlgL
MTWLSLGSLALPYQLQRQGVSLRSEISRLGGELTTGQTATPQKHLRGDIGPLAAIESRLSRIEAYQQSSRLVSSRVDATQASLSQLETIRETNASKMLSFSAAGIDGDSLNTAGRSAKSALADSVSALNLRVSGQAVFAGAATDTTPLPDADTILATILPLVSGLTNAQAIEAAVTSAFLDPGGAFETDLYMGADAVPGAQLGEDGSSLTHPTAADRGVRKLLSGLVMAALIAEPAMGLTQDQKQELARSSTDALFSAVTPLTALQASVGDAQSSLDARLLQLSTERDALHSSRNSLIGVDPYEAATRLEEARAQLETLYTVTARTSRLSLTGYL